MDVSARFFGDSFAVSTVDDLLVSMDVTRSLGFGCLVQKVANQANTPTVAEGRGDRQAQAMEACC